MILVAGATGSVGGRIVGELLGRGEAVRALVRPGSSSASLEAANVEIARGDLRQPATLDDACAGVATVICTASATRRNDDTPENVDARGTQNLVDAARAAGSVISSWCRPAAPPRTARFRCFVPRPRRRPICAAADWFTRSCSRRVSWMCGSAC